METLIASYWVGASENKDSAPMEWDWVAYQALEETGKLVIYSARTEANELAGVALYVITRSLHHTSLLAAVCDTFSVHRKFQGSGLGSRILSWTEHQLLAKSVNVIYHNFKTSFNKQPLFVELGFKEIERVYEKRIN